MSLLKYNGDVARAPKAAFEKMTDGGFEFITWSNAHTGARFIARKSTVEKKAHNKFAMKKEDMIEIGENEVIKLSDTSMTIDEVKFEMDANNTDELMLQEGLNGKEKTKITRKSINILEQVLYNPDFDCSILFKS
jgi:hypothetical protein